METMIEQDSQTTLSQLVARVSSGERITITENGVPVAVVVSVDAKRRREVREAIEEIKRLSKGVTLGPGLTIKEMIEEGRD